MSPSGSSRSLSAMAMLKVTAVAFAGRVRFLEPVSPAAA